MATTKAIDPKDRPSAVRVRRLLDELGLTQEQVAERAAALGSKLSRNDVNKVCTGLNQASTEKIREGLALGTGVHRLDLNAYLDGRLNIEDLQRRRLTSAMQSSTDSAEPTFGELDGWLDAEAEARETAQSTGSPLTAIDFAGARLMRAFGVPTTLTPRFVATLAWIWSQTATEDMRDAARKVLGQPSGPPPGIDKAGGATKRS